MRGDTLRLQVGIVANDERRRVEGDEDDRERKSRSRIVLPQTLHLGQDALPVGASLRLVEGGSPVSASLCVTKRQVERRRACD